MRLLVTGCGRSGTTWTAVALRTTGLDCGHERAFTSGYNGAPEIYDVDGDWEAEVSAAAGRFTPLRDTYVVRQVRHPLDVIASVVNRPTRHARTFTTRDAIIRDTIRYWIEANLVVVADETLRLEDIDADTITRLARIVTCNATDAIQPPPLHVAPTPSPLIRWEDIADYPEAEQLRYEAARYGYPNNDRDDETRDRKAAIA